MSNRLSWTIMKRFSGKNNSGFSYQDVVKEFPGLDHSCLTRALGNMVEYGMLSRIVKDLYTIVPLKANPEQYELDGRLVAKYIMKDEGYYIGYASALRTHGLKSYDDSRVYVVTEKRMKPSVRNIRGVTYKFIRHHSDGHFGFRNIWINQMDQVRVSDLEKTIADMASNPSPLGNIIELGRAIFQARNRTDINNLLYYLARNGNRAAMKRYLFFVDLLKIDWTSGHEQMMEELGSGIAILDPGGSSRGKGNAKFGLKVNVDPELIKKEIVSFR